jgi:hypothetical protein
MQVADMGQYNLAYYRYNIIEDCAMAQWLQLEQPSVMLQLYGEWFLMYL